MYVPGMRQGGVSDAFGRDCIGLIQHLKTV